MSQSLVQDADVAAFGVRESYTFRHVTASVLAAIAWAGVAAQAVGLIAIAQRHGWTAGQLLNGFFAYFTNLTNVLVAVLLTQHAIVRRPPRSRLAVSIDASAVVYIAIVGIVNAVMLRGVWTPHGWFLIGDVLCHIVLPIGYPIYWLAVISKSRLPWGDSLRWLVYPALFGVISVVRGMIIHWYPYPFFNKDKLGIAKVLLVLGVLGAAIVLIGAVVIAVDRALCDRDE